MPALAPIIGVILGTMVSTLVARVLFALGLGWATYQGFSIVLDLIEGVIVQAFGGVSADMVYLLSVLNVDRAITIVLSAYSARIALKIAMGANRKLSLLPGD